MGLQVIENEHMKIFCRIFIFKHLAHKTPNLIIVEKKQVWIVEVTIFGDERIAEKETEKITNYCIKICKLKLNA